MADDVAVAASFHVVLPHLLGRRLLTLAGLHLDQQAVAPVAGNEQYQDAFMDFAKKCNIVGIKGHRSVGGFRASCYNACTVEDCQALVNCMAEFEKQVKK